MDLSTGAAAPGIADAHDAIGAIGAIRSSPRGPLTAS
jgi:hypothetical protein